MGNICQRLQFFVTVYTSRGISWIDQGDHLGFGRDPFFDKVCIDAISVCFVPWCQNNLRTGEFYLVLMLRVVGVKQYYLVALY